MKCKHCGELIRAGQPYEAMPSEHRATWFFHTECYLAMKARLLKHIETELERLKQ